MRAPHPTRYANPLTEYSPQLETYGRTRESFDQGNEGIFADEQAEEFATRLLELTDEAELESFLGDLIGSAGRALGKIVNAPAVRAIGKVLKSVAKKALPIAGGVIGGMYGGPLGAQLGSGLGSAAGRIFGLELEGLSPEDREFQASKQFVRFAAETVRNALVRPERNATSAAREAAIVAARTHAPGLIFEPLTLPGDNAMHDIDRTGIGAEYESEYADERADEHEYEYESESESNALAAELMELETEEEFEDFLGALLKNAVSAVGGNLTSQKGRSLGSLLKGAARQLLPVVGQGLGAQGESDGESESEENELEESELEEREWEAATTFVKLAQEAGKIAAQSPPEAEPAVVANDAVVQAARVHAPSLVAAIPPRGAPFPWAGSSGGSVRRARPLGKRMSGRWIRRGNRIVLLGV
jgi:uncharacterized protein (DUF697 family)